MKGASALLLGFVLTYASATRASEPDWALTGAFRMPIIGPLDDAKRLTGSVLPTVQAAWHPPGASAVTLGLEGSYGLDSPRWAIVLGGLFASYSRQPTAVPVRFTGSVALLGGRVPVVNAWGLALNYSGVYPRAGAIVSWTPREYLTVGGGCDLYWVNTWSWAGLAPAPGLHLDGRF